MIGFLSANWDPVTWTWDPTFFTIFGLEIRYYGVLWATGILLGGLFFAQFVRREGYSPKVSDTIFIYGAIATVIGARLGHVLFYNPGDYFANPVEILKFRDGGLASHGGALGLLVGLYLAMRKYKMPYTWALDRVMVPVGIAGTLIRIGNLLNHEIYGYPTDLPWGFRFITNLSEWMKAGADPNSPLIRFSEPSHPTQLYEASCYLLLFGLLCFLYYKKDIARRYPGLLFGIGLIGVFVSRFFIEFVKYRQPGEVFGIDTGLDTGQLLSIPFIILGVVMVFYGLRHKQTPPPLADTSFFPKKDKAQKGGRTTSPATGSKSAKAAQQEEPRGENRSKPSGGGRKTTTKNKK